MKKPMKFLALLLASALAVAAFAACSPQPDDDTDDPTDQDGTGGNGETWSVTLNSDYEELFVGGGVQLTAAVTPQGETVAWTSSDESVATVSENGYVQAVGTGSATVTASAGEAEDTCLVLVANPVEATSLELSQSSLTMQLGWRMSLRADVQPANATVTWSTSDRSVVTVSASGSLLAVGAGTATVTATSGQLAASCLVYVRPGVGSEVPDFTVQVYDNATGELTDQTYSPADSLGKVTVINFWGIWCGPCKSELPAFDRIASEDEDVVVVAVHSVMSMAGAPSHIAENYPDSAIIFAQDSALSGAGTDDVITMMGGGMQYPYTVIVNAEGEITYLGAGSMTYEQLAALVAEAKA